MAVGERKGEKEGKDDPEYFYRDSSLLTISGKHSKIKIA